MKVLIATLQHHVAVRFERLNSSITKRWLIGLLTAMLALSVGQVSAQQSLRDKLSAAIETASGNQLKITALKKTVLPTIYEVQLSTGEILYSDISGDYLFAGDMYRTSPSGLVNLSATSRQGTNLEKLNKIAESEMIIFEPEETKATLTVFTDVDCTYCRKLHGELDQLLAYGIRVRYLAYPRGGADSPAFPKMVSVWCSSNRHKSFNQAKNGQSLPAADCETPILEHYALGNEFGVNGTPALVFPDGRLVPGYIEATRLAAMLGIL
jgi:thiol:disulfide interchange protein DsbC